VSEQTQLNHQQTQLNHHSTQQLRNQEREQQEHVRKLDSKRASTQQPRRDKHTQQPPAHMSEQQQREYNTEELTLSAENSAEMHSRRGA
jgi:hypothetical protein